MTLAVSEMFQVTPSNAALQIPPYAQAGPLKVLYNAGPAEGFVALAIKGKNESGDAIIYGMAAGAYLSGVGDIYVVAATGTTVTDLRGAATDDQTP